MLGPFTSQDVGFTFANANTCIKNGYLYKFGGGSLVAGSPSTDSFIKSAKILEDGSLGPSQDVGTGNTAIAFSFSATIIVTHGDYVFIIGGTTQPRNFVVRFLLGPNGTVSAPFLCPRFPVEILDVRCWCQIGDYVYLQPASGAGGSSLQLQAFKITVDGPQQLQTIGNIFALSSGHTFLPYKDSIISVGGSVGGVRNNDIWIAKVDKFNVGTWAKMGSIPTASTQIPCAIADDNIILMSGRISGTNPQTNPNVYSAKIKGLAIGPWTRQGDLPLGSFTSGNSGIVTSDTHVYMVGGNEGQVGGLVSFKEVQYAKILRGE